MQTRFFNLVGDERGQAASETVLVLTLVVLGMAIPFAGLAHRALELQARMILWAWLPF